MGWSPIRNIVGAVEDVVETVTDPVSDALASFEDSVRDVVTPVFDGFNEVIEDPYVQLIASIVDPTPGKVASTTLRTYAKANSGEDISASDLAQLGISSVTALGDVPIDPDTAKLMKSAATIADGGDVQSVIIDSFGEEAFGRIAPELENTARTALGDDTFNIVKDNIDPIKAGFRIAQGEAPLEVLADTYDRQIVDAIGMGDPTGYAALKTAVALDQGVDQDDALLAGGDYNKLVGNLDLDFGGLSEMGYDLPQLSGLGIDLNNINISTPDIFGSGLSLGEVADLGLDLSGMDFSGMSTADLGDYSVKELQDLGVDLPSLNLQPELQMIGLANLLEGDYSGLGDSTQPGEELAMLEPNLDFLQDDDTPFSRQLLETGKIA